MHIKRLSVIGEVISCRDTYSISSGTVKFIRSLFETEANFNEIEIASITIYYLGRHLTVHVYALE